MAKVKTQELPEIIQRRYAGLTVLGASINDRTDDVTITLPGGVKHFWVCGKTSLPVLEKLSSWSRVTTLKAKRNATRR